MKLAAVSGPRNPTHKKAFDRIISLGVSWLTRVPLEHDRTERAVYLFAEAIISFSLVWLILPSYGGTLLPVLFSLIAGHSLMFLVSTQFLLKNMSLWKADPRSMSAYLERIRMRITGERSLHAALLTGSVARGEMNRKSDLDMVLIRRSGILNGFRAVYFALKEEYRAFLHGFPLDIAVVDTVERAKKKYGSEPVIVIHDPSGVIDGFFEVLF